VSLIPILPPSSVSATTISRSPAVTLFENATDRELPAVAALPRL